MTKLQELLSYMKLTDTHDEIQLKQTRHRMRLVEAFQIKSGDRVLEVGSGQGDTTVVLAEAVGKTGFVDAVDIAASDYGAPLTLKQATDYISKSTIGSRINFQFETNVAHEDFTGEYDVAILSHSLFYFSSEEDILTLFIKLRQICKRICVSDWDLDFTTLAQSTHAQAILLQVLFAKYNDTDHNIQTLITKELIANLLKQAGWTILNQMTVDAKDLDDSKWEVAVSNELEFDIYQPVFNAYKEMMRKSEELTPIESLDSFVMIGI